MALKDGLIIASKFRGCLYGTLIGDCLGAPYEGEQAVSKVVLQNYFDHLEGPFKNAPYKKYTDDTAMTKCLADTLIKNKGFNPTYLAKSFVKEYYTEPRRGYGANVVEVFQKLRGQNIADPFGPAKEQFNGSGSYGNGASMRIAPVALFYHNNLSDLINIAKQSSLITHSNRVGYNGAILQALAIHQGLNLDPNENFNSEEFITNLISKMEAIEKDEEGLELEEKQPYRRQLTLMKKLLNEEEIPHHEKVVQTLGNTTCALFSVPTAIYCFLRAKNPLPDIKTQNSFRRTIQYAISLGGDTDTIASMAGAIAGAYYGESIINKCLIKHCEDSQEILYLAEALLEITE